MTKTPEELKSRAKTTHPGQEPEPNLSGPDHPDPVTALPDDLTGAADGHDSAARWQTPPIDTLTENSDLKGFLSPDIDEKLRRTALRKIFHSKKYNRRDGLDDYDRNYQGLQSLGNILTSDMRYHVARLADLKAESPSKRDPPVQSEVDTLTENTKILDPDPILNHRPHQIQEPTTAIPISDGRNSGRLFYQSDLCVHGTSGLSGCTRCVAVCPTGAIEMAERAVTIHMEMCDSKGLCTTVCPTEALSVSATDYRELLTAIRTSLAKCPEPYLPVIFYDKGLSPAGLQNIPENALLFPVAATASLGMDIWMASIAYGASHVVVMPGGDLPPAGFERLHAQQINAAKIIEGMQLGRDRIQLIPTAHDHPNAQFLDFTSLPPVCARPPAQFDPGDTRRKVIFQSIDHLYAKADDGPAMVALNTEASFGEIRIDPVSCTFCMACVAVCPAKALYDGGEIPQIRFCEAQCIQCGLCERACPENALRLSPRMVFDPDIRNPLRILHQAEAFCCVVCGRPFATKAMVDKITQKLSGHWMYQNDLAKNRLSMCWECRARDAIGKASSP